MNEHLGHEPDIAPCNPERQDMFFPISKQASNVHLAQSYEQTRQQTFKVSDSGGAPQQEGHIHG